MSENQEEVNLEEDTEQQNHQQKPDLEDNGEEDQSCPEESEEMNLGKNGEDELNHVETEDKADKSTVNIETEEGTLDQNEETGTEIQNKAVRDTENSEVPAAQASPAKGTKKSRRRKGKENDGIHRVTVTVTIAKAIPTAEEDGPKVEDLMRRKKRIVEAPKAQNYYHCQYHLLPDDPEPTRTDVVTFGMAAKIYTENDSKVLKTWQEGEQTWIAWSHSHTLKVTRDLLLKLFNHNLELRIWESRDKVSPRARFDRPKAFRLPQPKPGEDAEDVGGVKSLVLKQSQSYMALQPKKSLTDRPVPQNPPPELREIKNFGKTDAKGRPILARAVSTSPEPAMKSPEELLKISNLSDPQSHNSSERLTPVVKMGESPTKSPPDGASQPIKSYGHLSKIAGLPPPEPKKHLRERRTSLKPTLIRDISDSSSRRDTKDNSVKLGMKSPVAEKTSTDNKPYSPVSKKSFKDSPQQKEAKRKSQKAEQAAQALAAYIREHGNACIPIRMKLLFAGLRSVTNRLDKPVPGIEDVFITVALDGPLMSEELHKELNPLVLKVSSATYMPATPLSIDELSRRCEPVYTEYKFHNLPAHHSGRRPHAKNIYWEDINVVLLGTIPKGELLEYLRGPHLEILVHDRDRKPEEIKQKPCLFGADMEDDKISSVSMVTSRRTVQNPYKGHNRPWDPYGVAKFDLSGLLLGEKSMFLTAPIHNCPVPDPLTRYGGEEKMLGISNAVDGPKDAPLPPGHYIDADSQLKIKVEVAYPLISPQQIKKNEPLQALDESPFCCIIYMFEYMNTKFLHELLRLITHINAVALKLDVLPDHVIQAALSTYKLSKAQHQDKSLNIVTGFQIMDGERHIFVLEGLRDKAIKEIWDTLPRAQKEENVIFEVLYNSDMVFSERKYAELDVDLCRVKLHEPMSVIVQQPLLYVRDMVPRPCLEALIKLDQLVYQNKMRDVTKTDLFPSVDAIISLSREFGVPLTAADFEDLKDPSLTRFLESDDFIGQDHRAYQRKHPELAPLDIYNHEYVEYLADKEYFGDKPNHIKANIATVAQLSEEVAATRIKPKTIKVVPPNGVSHNYSTQMLNSTDQAKELLRQELAKNPDKRYTYCAEYNSASVVPVNVEVIKKKDEELAKGRWQTADGFVYPGVEPSMKCNEHAKRPDVARTDELKETWRENTLHANILNPTLEERDGFSWPDRHLDMNIWSRPSPHGFAPIPPITIHLSGDTLKAEKQASADHEEDTWKSKLVVDDKDMKFHRLTSDTELMDKGFHSSNQIDRLQGLLKDDPMKLALRQAHFEDVPALDVVKYPSVDSAAREAGVPLIPAEDPNLKEKHYGFVPGSFEKKSLLVDKNRIAIRNMEHEKFAGLKGRDFNAYHMERNMRYKPHIQPLSRDERHTALFQPASPPIESEKPMKTVPGNECFRQPPPGIKPAPIRTEYYYPDRELYWKSPCEREVTNRKQLANVI